MSSIALADDDARTAPVADPLAAVCTNATGAVNASGYLPIGGIDHWVTIKGASCANPVVVFVHGGPGNPLTPYADAVYGDWQRDFTLVQWDQRGAGRTFGRNPDAASSELSVESMARDGNELIAEVRERLHVSKVVLLGGSWGSALAVHMVKTRPELFSAYIGVGQLVKYPENQQASYDKVLSLARSAGDTKTVETLEALGSPPWSNPRAFGMLRRATRVYEKRSTTPAPAHWWTPAPEYATQQMQIDYEAGEEYSYLQFVGMDGQGMLSRLDLPKLGTRFEVPVFVVQGAHDLVTTADVAKRYFDSIEAPTKEFFLVERAGHDPNAALLETELHILKTRIGTTPPL